MVISEPNFMLRKVNSNGSSTPPRLPLLSRILLAAQTPDTRFTLAALSYRGYWTSSGRASQRGIQKDAQAFLQWATTNYPGSKIILWGQSIGAGIATQAMADWMKDNPDADDRISGLLLETPFVSVRRMLEALYPEKWVPYRYLWPFLRNWWDSEHALSNIATSKVASRLLLLPAGRDEVVPAQEADYLEQTCKQLNLDYTRKDVLGALHHEASTKNTGRRAIVEFLREVSERKV